MWYTLIVTIHAVFWRWRVLWPTCTNRTSFTETWKPTTSSYFRSASWQRSALFSLSFIHSWNSVFHLLLHLMVSTGVIHSTKPSIFLPLPPNLPPHQVNATLSPPTCPPPPSLSSSSSPPGECKALRLRYSLHCNREWTHSTHRHQRLQGSWASQGSFLLHHLQWKGTHTQRNIKFLPIEIDMVLCPFISSLYICTM